MQPTRNMEGQGEPFKLRRRQARGRPDLPATDPFQLSWLSLALMSEIFSRSLGSNRAAIRKNRAHNTADRAESVHHG
jgi:hypothetical protein